MANTCWQCTRTTEFCKQKHFTKSLPYVHHPNHGFTENSWLSTWAQLVPWHCSLKGEMRHEEWAAETAGLLGGPRRHCSSDGNTKPKRVPISLPLNIAIQLAWPLQMHVASNFLANGLRLDYPFQGLDRAALSGETKDTGRQNQGAFHASSFQKLLLQITTALSPGFRCLSSDISPPTRTKLLVKTFQGQMCAF